MGIKGRFVGIAGSAASDADVALLRRCHIAVRQLTRLVVERGGGLVVGAGSETRIEPDDPDTARVFYWTIMDEVWSFLCTDTGSSDPRLRVFCTLKASSEIPEARRKLWDGLIANSRVQVQKLRVEWNAGAYRRQRQASAGDAVVLLGGGEGVEHLGALYAERGRPVIPIDAPLGAFFNDGRGGADMLFRHACSQPERFVLDAAKADRLPTRLRSISLCRPDVDPCAVAQRLVDLLDDLVVPRAFFVRLLNKNVPEYADVEAFFSEVVTPCVQELRYTVDQIGLLPASEAFIDREIFERLHYADAVVADLTSLRNNAFLELGYALGRALPTIITAQDGTALPFDASTMPVHFWKTDVADDCRRQLFREHWRRCFTRPPLVRVRELG